MDAPHRLFSVCAGMWAVAAPWFLSDECGSATIRRGISRGLGLVCTGGATDVAVVVATCALPPVLAYLFIFVALPWVIAAPPATSDRSPTSS